MATVILNSDVRQHKRRPRINKHLTERRRRARINDSLFQLKNLVFSAVEDKLSHNSKVEKADILEMTLLYLRGLQKQNSTTQEHQPTRNHFQAGFSECLGEVSHFLLSCDSIDTNTRMQLLNHLANRSTQWVHSPTQSHIPAVPVTPASSPPIKRHKHTATYNNLSVDVRSTVHTSWNGNSFSLVTPPLSPMDATAQHSFVRNDVSSIRYFSEQKDYVGSSQMIPIWRPWLE